MKQKVTKYLIALVMALLLAPTLALAQTGDDDGIRYIDDNDVLGLGAMSNVLGLDLGGATNLQFRISKELGGAVITGIGNYDLTTMVPVLNNDGKNGVLQIPLTVASNTLTTGDLNHLLNLTLGGLTNAITAVPVVGIDDNAFNVNATAQPGIDFTPFTTNDQANLKTLRLYPDATILTFIGDVLLDWGDLFNGGNTALKMIGSNAFNSCTNITSVSDFSELTNLQTIGDYAFNNCPKIASDIVIPANLISIGAFAFAGDIALTSLNLTGAASLQTIGNTAFSGCAKLGGELFIPSKVETIGTGAFSNDVLLTSLNLTTATSLTTIGADAFYMCSGMRGNLTLPNSITTLGEEAFYYSGFDGLLTLPVNPLFTNISTSSLSEVYFTGPLTIPDNVTDIADLAFYHGNVATTKLAFDGQLTMSKNVKTIGMQAFQGCTGLTGDVYIPKTLESLNLNMFGHCHRLRSITFQGPNTLSFRFVNGGTSAAVPNRLGTGGMFAFDTNLEFIDMSAITLSNPELTAGMTLSRTRTSGIDPGGTYGQGDDPFWEIAPHTVVYLPQDPTGTLAAMIGTASSPVTVYHVITNGGVNMTTGRIDGNVMTQAQGVEGNYVLNGVCQQLDIESNTDYFFPQPFQAVKAFYNAWNYADYTATYPTLAYNSINASPNTRHIYTNTRTDATSTNGLATYSYCYSLYLPYPFKLPKGMVGYKLMDYQAYNDSLDLPAAVFKSVDDGKFEANTPYLVRIEDPGHIYSASDKFSLPDMANVTVAQSPVGYKHMRDDGVTPVPSAIENATMQQCPDGCTKFFGSTEAIDNATSAGWTAYNLLNDLWHPIQTDTPSGYIGQMRGFIVYDMDMGTSNGAKPMLITGLNGMDTPTSIDDLFGPSEPVNSVETRVYSINGQYLGKDINVLPKGLYIVNGKKVIKK